MSAPFEVRDSEIDSAALLDYVRRRLDARREAGQLPPAPPEFGLPPIPAASDASLRYHLDRINATYDDIWPELTLAPSPVAHVPILGRLWQLFRGQMHRLILYYMDMLASKQVRFNEHVVGVLNRMVALQQENAILRREIADLSRRLDDLSAHDDVKATQCE